MTSDTVIPRFPGDAIGDREMFTTESGLMYVDLEEGAGETPPDSTSKVSVHYTGWLVDGTKFDSSVDRGQPIVFPLNGVIKGWTEGVGDMKVGGKRKLVIPFDLAYGPAGRGPIPANATLIFDVQLLGIED
ncbi:MAG: FKBP-type peptidyl-prolyl cis-trans isomerase [Phycisphaera sp. TMED9]|nr:MAG: FKBP-type peptidyl-prolyl cis-trans isomerase [Phycisphaera sp. TMED9]